MTRAPVGFPTDRSIGFSPLTLRLRKWGQSGMQSWIWNGGAIVWLLAVLSTGVARAEGVDAALTAFTKGSSVTVDHSAFDALLKAYVAPAERGLNRVDYKALKAEKHRALKAYIASLEKVNVATLDRPEQFAFWANLYNAKTVDIVLDKYPVKSIKDISLGGGLIAAVTGGPWKAKVLRIAGREVSLDDIEHGILRPIFKDSRVHSAVNCATVGCPNIGREALSGARLDEQLDAAARAFINSPRGIVVSDGRVTASSIYSWFQNDFGGTPAGVLEHARRYADPALKKKLDGMTSITEFGYDWTLNETRK